jgi:hypothetical protein
MGTWGGHRWGAALVICVEDWFGRWASGKRKEERLWTGNAFRTRTWVWREAPRF